VKAETPLSPAVRKIVTENKLEPANIPATGKDGRLTKGDVIEHLSRPVAKPIAMPAAAPAPSGGEERMKMSRLRLTIARRLKEAQNTAAMLTTFNEVDMSAVMALRNEFKEMFEKKHGVKLGFMSFFAKAVIQALKDVPAVNAEIDGEDLVYKNYYHLGVAVGTEKGLVVPVVRDADRMSFATIEKTIAEYGKKARDGQLQIADMQGGTFTISNGGVYGSLMSTPILNAPQSGILGMHKIQDRPVAVNGQVVIRPMMYLALSYDHRIVDGKEAVTFLVRVKESLEDPQRALLDL
jgi:2-oxoglutarate dehydrogenase E2 component (dihydrolipoamide succinyltransferase)